jgi:hypothetical protein
MNDTNSNGYGTDDPYGSSGYNSPGYQSSGYEAPGYKSPGYGDGTGYKSLDATEHQQLGYAPLDTWASGYQENVYDRANLLDTPYMDTVANPNPSNANAFEPYQTSIDPYGSTNQAYHPPQPLPKPKPQTKIQSSPNYGPYQSSTFELEL